MNMILAPLILVALSIGHAAPSAPVILTPGLLPWGLTGAPYSIGLEASGGLAPYEWLVSTGELSAGLGLSVDGSLSGVPTRAGRFRFTVRVEDANGESSMKALTLEVRSPTELASFQDSEFTSWTAREPVTCGGWGPVWSAARDLREGNPGSGWRTLVAGPGYPGYPYCYGQPIGLLSLPSDPSATFDPAVTGGVGRLEVAVDMRPLRLQWGVCCGVATAFFVIEQGGGYFTAGAFTLYTAPGWRTYQRSLLESDFQSVGFPPAPLDLVSGGPFRVGLLIAYEPQGTQGNVIENVFDNFSVALHPDQPYGCGINPADSLTVLSGIPSVGRTIGFGVDNPLGTQPSGSVPALAIAFEPAVGFPCGRALTGWGMSPPSHSGELLVGHPASVLLGRLWAGAGQPSRIDVPIPNNQALIGLPLYLQGLLVSPASFIGPSRGLTNGLRLVIGP